MTDNDIRDYPLMDRIDNIYRSLSTEQLKGAHIIINTIAAHLNKKHFEDKIEINMKALVKTFGELDEIGMEILHHEHKVNLLQ